MTITIGSPPPLHPNRINAMFLQWRNTGQFYLPLLGEPPLSIYEWRERELERWNNHPELHANAE